MVVEVAIVLTIDPARDMSEIILRLAKSNLPIVDVSTIFNTIYIDASADDFAQIGTIPGVTSIEVLPDLKHIGFGPAAGSANPHPLNSASKDAELDAGFTTTIIK